MSPPLTESREGGSIALASDPTPMSILPSNSNHVVSLYCQGHHPEIDSTIGPRDPIMESVCSM